MTRDEFLENVNDWYELRDFCDDVGCDYCEDVYDDEGRDDYINECLMDWARNDSWYELRDRLADIPTGYEFYRIDDCGDWRSLDDSDFDQYKQEVLEWMDDNEYWDEEEDDEYDDDFDIFAEELANESTDDDNDLVEDEDFSVGDLIGMCSVAFVAIRQENVRRIQEEDKRFSEFVDVNVPKTLK